MSEQSSVWTFLFELLRHTSSKCAYDGPYEQAIPLLLPVVVLRLGLSHEHSLSPLQAMLGSLEFN